MNSIATKNSNIILEVDFMENIYTLQRMIDYFCRENNLHICIHDVKNVLWKKALDIERKYKIHSIDFCENAKNTEIGYKKCIKCKTDANIRAVTEKQTFCQHCAFGLYEIVKPVNVDEETVCIIYIGNLVYDHDKSLAILKEAIAQTGAESPKLLEEFSKAKRINRENEILEIADILDSYIKLLLENAGPESENSEGKSHRKVSEITKYISENFSRDIQLKELAGLYFVNEKYLGRVFKKEMGISFNEYLNEIRLDEAAKQLIKTTKSVLEISLDCGFKNVTYFNRKFKSRFEKTPSVYRYDKTPLFIKD